MHFFSYGAGKRWYNKVVKAAAHEIDDLLNQSGQAMDLCLAAEYNEDVSDVAAYRVEFNNKEAQQIITFGVQSWSTLNESIPSANQQLASVICTIGETRQLRRLFDQNGIEIVKAQLSTTRLPDDHQQHACVYIEKECSVDEFLRSVEKLEAILARTGTGIVDGTGYGIQGWSIDLSANDMSECLVDVKTHFEGFKISIHE